MENNEYKIVHENGLYETKTELIEEDMTRIVTWTCTILLQALLRLTEKFKERPGGSASRRSRGRLVSHGVGMCALCKSEQLSNTTSDQIGTDQIHIDVKQRWAALSLEQLRAVRLVLILATPLMRCGFPTGL